MVYKEIAENLTFCVYRETVIPWYHKIDYKPVNLTAET